jgi:hypothetical protein
MKNHYNMEAARGASFSQGGSSVSIFYGIGGCLAMPAQNGWDVAGSTFRSSMESNFYMGTGGGYGQNQCLRHQQLDGKAQLLPFGVSVCRTCCIAGADYYDSGDGPCNFWPYGTAMRPNLDATNFNCATAGGGGCAYDGSNAGSVTDCDICHMEMYPNFSMFSQPDYSASSNVFEINQGGTPFCTGGVCTPEAVYGGSQQIVG